MRDTEERRNDEIQRGIHGLPHAGHDLAAHNMGRQMAGREPVPACFPGSALVMTPLGRRRIDTINVGDTVWSWSEAQTNLVARRVKKVRAYGPATIKTITFANGENSLHATGLHTVLTVSGWRRINQLNPGDDLSICDGGILRTARITSVSTCTERAPGLAPVSWSAVMCGSCASE